MEKWNQHCWKLSKWFETISKNETEQEEMKIMSKKKKRKDVMELAKRFMPKRGFLGVKVNEGKEAIIQGMLEQLSGLLKQFSFQIQSSHWVPNNIKEMKDTLPDIYGIIWG